MNCQVFQRLILCLGLLKDGPGILERLELGGPIHPSMQVLEGLLNGFLDRDSVLW